MIDTSLKFDWTAGHLTSTYCKGNIKQSDHHQSFNESVTSALFLVKALFSRLLIALKHVDKNGIFSSALNEFSQ